MRRELRGKAASHKQEESHKPAPKAKRAKTSKPQPEPVYFEDKPNLWDQLDSVYQFNWNFSNLEDAFEKRGGTTWKESFSLWLYGMLSLLSHLQIRLVLTQCREKPKRLFL